MKKKLTLTPEKMYQLYYSGMSMPAISKLAKVSRERVRQILRKHKPDFIKNSYKGILRTPRQQRACKHCGKSFTVILTSSKKFCSHVCFMTEIKKNPYANGTKEAKEWKRKRAAEKANTHYHNVFKKKPNWREILKERNKKYHHNS